MKMFQPSMTNFVHAEIHRLRSEGVRVYNFASGDPIIEGHPDVIEEVKRAAKRQGSPYVPVGGLFELRDAAVQWMNQRYGSSYGRDHVIVTCGGKFALFAAIQVLVEREEEVLFTAPYWPSYPALIAFGGAIPKPISLNEKTHWKLTPEEFKKQIGKKTKALLLNNGCNPTGALYSREEIAALLHVAKEANLFVISDEVYSELVYDGANYVSCAAFPEHFSRVVVVESCSKNFAMAGWRVGFAFAEPKIIQNLIAIQSQTTTGTSFVGQRAALYALLHAKEVAEKVRRRMDARRKLFFKTYNALFHTAHPPTPSALYFFTQIPASTEKILQEAHVALVAGSAFGMEGYVRFAFSESEEEIVEGLKSLKKFLEGAKSLPKEARPQTAS